MGKKTEGFDKGTLGNSRPHQGSPNDSKISWASGSPSYKPPLELPNPLLGSLSASRTYDKSKLSTLILGVGNPILGDDGVGIAVAREIAKLDKVDVKEAETLGLDILNMIEEYCKVVIIDAIVIPKEKPGKIIRIENPEKTMTAHSASPHDTSFASALQTGRKLGMKIPKIVVYGINVEQKNLEEFREGLSPEVERAARKAANLILEEIKEAIYSG